MVGNRKNLQIKIFNNTPTLVGRLETILQRLVYCLDTEIVASLSMSICLFGRVSHTISLYNKIRANPLWSGTEICNSFNDYEDFPQ